MNKINYYYIDESGSLGNNSKIFIHGCIKTNSPDIIEESIQKLKKELIDDLYFQEFVAKIISDGFHAVQNHPDIRTHFYKIIPFLEYRAYFVILDKTTNYYQNLKRECSDYQIFEYSLKKLITSRVLKGKLDKNIFYFENIEIKGKSLNRILEDLFNSLPNDIKCEYHIVGKEEVNLSVIDYLNYTLYQIIKAYQDTGKASSSLDRMKLNFEIASPKIGVINFLHNKSFLSRKKDTNNIVSYNNVLKKLGGQLE
jgi:hypothetical protein